MRVIIAIAITSALAFLPQQALAQKTPTELAVEAVAALSKALDDKSLNRIDANYRNAVNALIVKIEAGEQEVAAPELAKRNADALQKLLKDQQILGNIGTVQDSLGLLAAQIDMLAQQRNPPGVAISEIDKLKTLLPRIELARRYDVFSKLIEFAPIHDSFLINANTAGTISQRAHTLADMLKSFKGQPKPPEIGKELADLTPVISAYQVEANAVVAATQQAIQLKALLQADILKSGDIGDPNFGKAIQELFAAVAQKIETDAPKALSLEARQITALLRNPIFNKGAPKGGADDLRVLREEIDKKVAAAKPDYLPRLNIIHARYGDLRRGANKRTRQCNALQAMRTHCQGLGNCAAPAVESLCIGGDPVPHADPRFKALAVQYQCPEVGEEEWQSLAPFPQDAVTTRNSQGRAVTIWPVFTAVLAPTEQLLCQSPIERKP